MVRAMQKDLARRFQSAREFADAVDQYLTGMVTPASVRSTPIFAVAPPQQGNHCGACSGIMVSKLSVAGRCEVCGAPICQKCWHVHRLRHCSQHVKDVSAAGKKVSASVAVAQFSPPNVEKDAPRHDSTPRGEPVKIEESVRHPAESALSKPSYQVDPDSAQLKLDNPVVADSSIASVPAEELLEARSSTDSCPGRGRGCCFLGSRLAGAGRTLAGVGECAAPGN